MRFNFIIFSYSFSQVDSNIIIFCEHFLLHVYEVNYFLCRRIRMQNVKTSTSNFYIHDNIVVIMYSEEFSLRRPPLKILLPRKYLYNIYTSVTRHWRWYIPLTYICLYVYIIYCFGTVNFVHSGELNIRWRACKRMIWWWW